MQPGARTLSSAMGLPMKMTILCRWFLFCRCFNASWAICTAADRLAWPSIARSCAAPSCIALSKFQHRQRVMAV